MSVLRYFVLIFFATTSLTAIAQTETPEAPKILHDLQVIDQKEIAVGQMAEENGSNADIKKYGKTLINDHKDLEVKIGKYAKQHKFELPPAKATDVSAFRGLTGQAFDRIFLSEMMKGHKEAIDMVDTTRSATSDLDLKKFLEKVGPSLHKHEKMAESLDKNLGPAGT